MHVHVRDSGLAAVAVCDKDYPPTAAFSIAAKVRKGLIESLVAKHLRAAAATAGTNACSTHEAAIHNIHNR